MNAHLTGSICATRPNRSSGRRRPPRRRRCPSATHRPALRSIDRRSKSASDPRTLLTPPQSQRRRQQLPLFSNEPRSDAGVLGPPWMTKAPPGARRPVRWHPPRAAPAGAPTTAVAPPRWYRRLFERRPWACANARSAASSAISWAVPSGSTMVHMAPCFELPVPCFELPAPCHAFFEGPQGADVFFGGPQCSRAFTFTLYSAPILEIIRR